MAEKQKDEKKMSRSEAGRKGGETAHEKGTAHEWNREEARAAGQKGGEAAHEKGTAHEFSSTEAREAGRKGGEAPHERSSHRRESDETARYTTVALLCENGELSQSRKLSLREAAMPNELAEPQQLAPRRQWSSADWVPDAHCSCGCGSADGRARLHWGRATNDER